MSIMAQFSGGQMQIGHGVPPTNFCDYCQQKPKLPPYDYCSKACGSRAKASGNLSSSNPVICKQCGQRPVYKGHQFCGRNCANDWQTMNGQINTGWNRPSPGQQQWYTPPLQTQNSPTQPSQGFNQGGVLKGIFSSLKGLVSPGQQLQQPGPPNHIQHVSVPAGVFSMVSPAMSSVPPETPNGNPNHFQHTQVSSAPPVTCWLSGCNNPVFIDSVTFLPGEYCSQRHREDAMFSGQVNPCLMCQKMPRSRTDHFCSRACREKALNP